MKQYLYYAVFGLCVIYSPTANAVNSYSAADSTSYQTAETRGIWGKTKEITADTWDGTKEVTGDVWDGAKKVTGDIWDGTKEVAGDIKEGISSDNKTSAPKTKTDNRKNTE